MVGWERFNRTHNMTKKVIQGYFREGMVETTSSKAVIANHPLLFYKNQ